MVEENRTCDNSENSNNRQNNIALRDLRGVFIAAVWALIFLVLVATFWPNLQQRGAFFTGNLFNLIIAFAVVAQVVIYRKQWRAMLEGLKETRISRELENAAFVGTKGASFQDGGLHKGQWQRIHVTVVNTGRTPAFNLRVTQGWGFSPAGPVDFVPPTVGVPPKGHSTVMPNYDAMVAFAIPEVTEDDLNAINKFQKFIYVWGTIDYNDIFGRPHWTRFCLMHHPTTNVFDSCGHWNECDYQYPNGKKPET